MKRRKIDKNDKKNQEKHPGGPLQRTGVSADSWNEALGSSIETIPFGNDDGGGGGKKGGKGVK